MRLSHFIAPALLAPLLAGCIGLGAQSDDPLARARALPGESWLYSYANNPNAPTSTLIMIDAATGTAHPIGDPIAGHIDALAFDEDQRVLYGAWRAGTGQNVYSELVTIDWHTGDLTFVGPFAGSPGSGPSQARVQGMTIAPDGALLGFTHSPQRLVAIDTSAGFQRVAELNLALHSYGAAFVDGTLHAVNATNQHLQVFEVDASDGTSTRHLHEKPGGFSIGATTDDLGTFYAVFGDELYTLDPSTFARTSVGPVGHAGLGSLAWISEPLDLISLDEACPCDADWKSHGQYVSCVAHWANEYAADEDEHGEIVSEAGRSDCGKPPHAGGPR